MTESAALRSADREVLAPEQFSARLRAQGTRYHNLHPFHRRMDAGELTREELQRWVSNRFYYQKCIPLKDAAILGQLPRGRGPATVDTADHRPRRSRRRNGRHRVVAATGRGAERLERRAHVRGARSAPGCGIAVDAYVNFARQKPWIEAVASSLTELFGPAAIRVRLEALERHYDWIDPAGLDYFRARLVQAPRDAQYALDLTVARCRTRERQDAAVAALRFKTEVLWAQLDAIERGDTQPRGDDA